MRGLLIALVSIGMAGGAFQAHASSLLFTTGGAGTVAVTIGTNVTSVTSLGGSITITSPTSTDVALAFDRTNTTFTTAAGTSPSATIGGEIDFSAAATHSTSGSCTADSGGTCKVDSSTTFGTSTSVTGITQEDVAVASAAATQWNSLITASTAAASGASVNLSGGGTQTLCVGSGSGCNNNTVTLATGQTAYVFTISADRMTGNITINGNNSGNLVILNYVGTASDPLATGTGGATFSLTGGLTQDQVLLNIESGGLTTSSGLTFNGAISVQGADADLADATIHGRLYVDTSGTSQTDELGSGFDLIAPPDVTPEPGTMFLMGFALIGLGLIAKRKKIAEKIKDMKHV